MFNCKKMRELMDAKGIGQCELADIIGCTQSYVSYLERGLKRPSIEQVIRMADTFGCTVDELCIREKTA